MRPRKLFHAPRSNCEPPSDELSSSLSIRAMHLTQPPPRCCGLMSFFSGADSACTACSQVPFAREAFRHAPHQRSADRYSRQACSAGKRRSSAIIVRGQLIIFTPCSISILPDSFQLFSLIPADHQAQVNVEARVRPAEHVLCHRFRDELPLEERTEHLTPEDLSDVDRRQEGAPDEGTIRKMHAVCDETVNMGMVVPGP
jgi:hypothetical protein